MLQQNTLSFPCLEKIRTKFPVFPVLALNLSCQMLPIYSTAVLLVVERANSEEM